MGKFQESVATLKREKLREYAKTHNEWVDPDSEKEFDDVIARMKDKRDRDYLAAISKKYPAKLIEKVIEFTRTLSPLELKSHKSFEDLCVSFIEENKDNPELVSVEDLELFLGKDGKVKKFISTPDDIPLGELEMDGEGNVVEKPSPPKPRPSGLSDEEVRKMSSGDLEKILPRQGTAWD